MTAVDELILSPENQLQIHRSKRQTAQSIVTRIIFFITTWFKVTNKNQCNLAIGSWRHCCELGFRPRSLLSMGSGVLTQCYLGLGLHECAWTTFSQSLMVKVGVLKLDYTGLNNNISQVRVATCFKAWYMESLMNHFIANFLLSVLVKEFWKLVNIWQRYGYA